MSEDSTPEAPPPGSASRGEVGGVIGRCLRRKEEGRLKALVGGVYRLSDLHRAQSDFKAKTFVGKLVVVPDSKWPPAVTLYSEREDGD